jgi:hypothetical protein
VPVGAAFLLEEATMDRHANKIRFILATCLTLFAVGAARAALPEEGVTQPALDLKVVNELAMELKTQMGD